LQDLGVKVKSTQNVGPQDPTKTPASIGSTSGLEKAELFPNQKQFWFDGKQENTLALPDLLFFNPYRRKVQALLQQQCS